MSIDDIKAQAEERMGKALSALHDNFSSVRTGRANAMALDRIKVDYYGVPTPVNQMAGVKTPDAHMLVIEPWDKTTLKAIEKAILESDLGVTPSNDGTVIRLPFPALTEERRRDAVEAHGRDGGRVDVPLLKVGQEVEACAEEARVAIRNIRRDANSAVEKCIKEDSLPEDEQRRAEGAIQKITDKFIAEVDESFKKKEAEVMEV